MKMLKLLTTMLVSASFSVPSLMINHTINTKINQEGQIDKNQNLNNKVKQAEHQEILNFDDSLREALYFDYLTDNPKVKIYQINNIVTNNLTHDNIKGSIKGTPTSKELPYGIYFGQSIFENNFDIEQIFSTPNFTKTVETTLTSLVIWGINNKTKLSFKYLNFTTEFSYSKTDTKTQTTTQSFISPTQNIKVPANKSYKVTIYLAASQGNANINLEEDITGSITAKIVDQNGSHYYQTTVGKAFRAMKNHQVLPKTIAIKDDNTIHFNGLGTISSFANKTNYNAKIEDITNK